MKVKRKNKEQKKKEKKAARLRPLVGQDLCACGTLHCLRCEGKCRELHTTGSGVVECGEKYQVSYELVNPKQKKKRRKRFQTFKSEVKGKRRHETKKGENQ